MSPQELAGVAAVTCVVAPAAAAAAIAVLGRRAGRLAPALGIVGALVALAAAVAEQVAVARGGSRDAVGFLGEVDLGVTSIRLELHSAALSAAVALAVAVVAGCVQIFSTVYLPESVAHGHPRVAVRYHAFAAEVSLFTAAMMLVVHSRDLVLLLIGWEVMGLCSYLLIGHHSERDSARAAAVKAFLVTRVGDLGVMVGIVLLLVSARTTSIPELIERADTLPAGTVTAAACLLLAGVIGKSAQFPLHTWLPDAMEGPTPVSALIHAATMVVAGVYLVARLLPLFLAAPVALDVAAVLASITMLGAALAAVGANDLKRLLAWSTISQVAYMLAGVAVATSDEGAGPGIFHLLTHAAFKALLFLAAGCIAYLIGSTSLADMGGLRRSHPGLAVLLGLGLAALAGIFPLSGFWSKEAVLSAAEVSFSHHGGATALVVLVSGLTTAFVTGIYCGRAFAVVALGPPTADPAKRLPRVLSWPLWLLAVPTAGAGLLLVDRPPVLAGVEIEAPTAVITTALSLVGVGWALSAPRLGRRDVADALPARLRALLLAGYRLDQVQHAVVVRPYRALCRLVATGDLEVVDAYPRGSVVATTWAGRLLRRAETGLIGGYLAWLVLGASAIGVCAVVFS